MREKMHFKVLMEGIAAASEYGGSYMKGEAGLSRVVCGPTGEKLTPLLKGGDYCGEHALFIVKPGDALIYAYPDDELFIRIVLKRILQPIRDGVALVENISPHECFAAAIEAVRAKAVEVGARSMRYGLEEEEQTIYPQMKMRVDSEWDAAGARKMMEKLRRGASVVLPTDVEITPPIEDRIFCVWYNAIEGVPDVSHLSVSHGLVFPYGKPIAYFGNVLENRGKYLRCRDGFVKGYRRLTSEGVKLFMDDVCTLEEAVLSAREILQKRLYGIEVAPDKP